MNKIIEKLAEKFLPEAEIKDEICQESCHHCEEELGCTKWKDKIGDIRDKIKNIQNLEKKLINLERELELVEDESKAKTWEEIEKTKEKLAEEHKKIANSRPKEITIRLTKNPDNKTIAHEFAHAFLVWHHCPRGHHGEKYEAQTQENTFLFYSLKEFFLQEIKKIGE